ncbi:MAG: TatD family hydrolase [Desulfobulbaceae bacterium]|nr:TatD family hydrolase [Desulfobulbaceae bacterium]
MAKNKKDTPLPVLPAGGEIIDTHCHLDMGAYREDLQEVLDRARGAGVGRLLTIGIDLESSREAVRLAGAHPGIYAAVGVHPHHVAETSDDDYRELRRLAAQPRVVAYGEVGMDAVRNYAPLAVQMEHFRRQVRMAKELSLPLIVHDRETHDAIMAVLEEEGPFSAGGVMHCFSGDRELAVRVVRMGFYVSIPGVVTFANAGMLREVVEAVPLERLLVETDGPFLAPEPKRGKRNEPAYVLYTAHKVAEIKGVELAEVARQTTANAEALFGMREG